MKTRYLILSLLVILSFIMMGCDDKKKDNDDDGDTYVDIMYFTLEDGQNMDEERGCFFVIRAGKGVNIDPSRYSFYVSEVGYSPQNLDFDLREYNDYDPYDPKPNSGDRNASYNYKIEGNMWSDGEYIGFDMPMEDMNIDIKTGIYEVMIKNPKDELIYSDTFAYTRQGF